MVVDKNKVYVPPVPIAKMNLRCEDKECLQNLMSPYSKSFGKKNESSASCLHGAKFSTYRTCVGYEKKSVYLLFTTLCVKFLCGNYFITNKFSLFLTLFVTPHN